MPDMNKRLTASLEFTLRWEGGYVNHPNDPGGATNKGVTKRVYDAYRQDKGLAPSDVREITDVEVHDIYENRYWRLARCPALLIDLDTVQFDTAVNMGVGRAIKIMQRSTGCVADGAWGPKTAAAVAGCNAGETLKAHCDLRESFYNALTNRKPDMRVFLQGWMNRLNDLRSFVGLPGHESSRGVPDFGDTGFVLRLNEETYDGEDNFL